MGKKWGVLGTALHIRLTRQEQAKVDDLVARSGRTISQVIRDALAAYELPEPKLSARDLQGNPIETYTGSPDAATLTITRMEASALPDEWQRLGYLKTDSGVYFLPTGDRGTFSTDATT